jgi:hypothetical protein
MSKANHQHRQMVITEEDFSAWLEHPVTRAVMEKLQSHIKEAEVKWMQHSWGRGGTDPLVLADLRARAIVLTEIVRLEHKDM